MPTLARRPLVLGASLACLVAVGCRSKQPSGAVASGEPPRPAPSSSDAAPEERCHVVGRGPGLVVGDASRPAKAEEDDDAPELPFAAEIGGAVTLPGAFAVSGLSSRSGGSEAFVAFLPADGKPGRSVSFGPVHGDPDPPLLAAEGQRVLVAVEDSDAAGGVVRLATLSASANEPESGSELTGVVSAAGVALAAGEHRALLVWGTRKAGAVSLRAASLDPARPATLGNTVDLAGTAEPEAPVLRARPGGYWLTWISQRPAADAGARPVDAGKDDDPRLLDAGPRVLMVALLHDDGTPAGSARAVSGEASHVVGFDAAALPDGALALAWREDEAAPGVETGGLELARVKPDGSVERGHAGDGELSAGAPSLVAEAGPAGHVWISVPGADDALRVGLLAPTAVATSAMLGEPSLRGAEILAAADGRFLLGRSRSRAVELSVAKCRLEP